MWIRPIKCYPRSMYMQMELMYIWKHLSICLNSVKFWNRLVWIMRSLINTSKRITFTISKYLRWHISIIFISEFFPMWIMYLIKCFRLKRKHLWIESMILQHYSGLIKSMTTMIVSFIKSTNSMIHGALRWNVRAIGYSNQLRRCMGCLIRRHHSLHKDWQIFKIFSRTFYQIFGIFVMNVWNSGTIERRHMIKKLFRDSIMRQN